MPTTGEETGNGLTARWHSLLLAAVQEFIASGEPVGSHQIASRYRLGVKAAMARNLMAQLEEAGYLHQPHTSAGRIPTAKAFRYYVDQVIPRVRLGFEDRAQIELHYSEHSSDLSQVMRDTSRLLALLTKQAALVTAPRLESVIFEQVGFVRIREREVLAVIVTAAGGAQSHLVQTDRDHSQSELDRMARYLNESLKGLSLEAARLWIESRLKDESSERSPFEQAALAIGTAAASSLSSVEVYVEGSTNALEQPEFADHDRLRDLLRALEDKSELLNLLERSLSQPSPMVLIGSENPYARLANFAVVASSYVSGSSPAGSLAVVGPVRMNYERVIPLVEYTARALSRLFEP